MKCTVYPVRDSVPGTVSDSVPGSVSDSVPGSVSDSVPGTVAVYYYPGCSRDSQREDRR